MTLRFVCLALLAEESASGYDICRRIRASDLRYYVNGAQATVYAMLKQLERGGELQSERRKTPGRPDRIVFHITPAGRGLVRVDAIDPDAEGAIPILMRFSAQLPCAQLHSVAVRQLAAARSILDDEAERTVPGTADAPLAAWLDDARLSYCRFRVDALTDLVSLLAGAERSTESRRS